MGEVGLNENISIGDRTFHIQTSTSVSNGVVKSEVFEKGRLLNTIYNRYERRNEDKGAEVRIKKLVETFHKNIIDNIGQIFSISAKVKQNKDVYGHLKVGILFYNLNLLKEAVDHLTIVISMNEHNQLAYKYLIKCALKIKDYQRALILCREALKAPTCYADLYYVVGLVYLKTQNYIEAIQSFKKSIAQNSDYFEAYVQLMIAFIESYSLVEKKVNERDNQQKYKFLSALSEKMEIALLNNHDKNRYSAFKLNEVTHAIEGKNYTKALDILKKMSEMFVSESDNYRILGYEVYLRVKYDLENLTEEDVLFYENRINDILKLHPEYSDLYNVLGLIYLVYTKNLFNTSLENFDRALELNEKFVIAKKNRKLVENDGREVISILNSILK